MPRLSFISDEQLQSVVEDLLLIAKTGLQKAQTNFDRNVIDPFAAVFEMSGFEIKDIESWQTIERTRQAQKTLSNGVGMFHQKILGSVTGWEDLGVGKIVDNRSTSQKIIADIKNKHNTVKGSDLAKLYDGLAELVMPKTSTYFGYTAYYVTIIPKQQKVFDVPFAPSDNKTGKKRQENPAIRAIDGRSFYALVTGVDNALEQLFDALPFVIKSVSSDHYAFTDKTALKELFRKVFEK